MDDRRFDDLARALAGVPTSRRSGLRWLIGAALGALGGAAPAGRAAAQAIPCLGAGAKCRKPAACCSGICKKKRGAKSGKCFCLADGKACTATTAAKCCSGICQNDQCTNTCSPGTASCDGDPANCETNTNTDLQHCGGCNQPCTVANGTPACVAGQCTIAACNPGFDNCNDGPSNGCETNTQNDVDNCGACDFVCPGGNQTTATATCVNQTCAFTCKGDNYDVDGDPTNGCEAPDDGHNNHTPATIRSLGSKSCDNSSSRTSFSGRIVSDNRQHLPAPAGFDPTTGAAPDWWVVSASGGTFCSNDLVASITTTGGAATGTCYRLTVETNRVTRTANVSGSGTASIPSCSGSCYTDGTTIRFKVEKTCSTSESVPESIGYTVSFNL